MKEAMDGSRSNDIKWLSEKVPQFENTTVFQKYLFTWKIENFATLSTKVVSPTFEVGNFKWQLLMHPHGNPSSPRKGSIALFLYCVGPVDGKKDWHVCASFAFAIWNPHFPDVNVTQITQHRFTPRISDWGFDDFTRIRSAFMPLKGQPSALISKNPNKNELEVNISVAVEVLDDPTGVLWHDFLGYDSKDATGYTGLVNQGATCYLNSLLQSLYFTKAFRNSVYDIPDGSGVTGGLQRLFYKLSTSHPPVDTNDLTETFGWNTADAFTQHDVQELCRILMDRLEAKMKGTEVDGFLSKLFVGRMTSYIKCINVPFESSVTENFWDIQLNVKGMENVYQSFDDYCSVETLEGDNQYAAGDHGLQDAIKGVSFESLPPVLHLQLKRYDYNWENNMEIKVNDHYEFPIDLDLKKYVEKEGDWNYTLHGVLVHSGDLNAGHYYALIKPEIDSGWFKFDDDRVTKATLHEVLDENFGGDEGTPLRRVTSAYMLVYVRKDSLDFVLPHDTKKPPRRISNMVEAEQRADNMYRREITEQRQFMKLRVLTNENFRYHFGRGYFNRDNTIDNSGSLDMPRPTRVHTDFSFASLHKELGAKSLFVSYKSVYAVENTRSALDYMVPIPNLKDAHWSGIRDQAKDDIPIFFKPMPLPDSKTNYSEFRLIFVKMFDEEKNMPRGVGAFWVHVSMSLMKFFAVNLGFRCTNVMLEILGAESSSEPNDLLVPIDPTRPISELLLKDADIVIVSKDTENLKQYYDDIAKRVTLEMTPYKAEKNLDPNYDDIDEDNSDDEMVEDETSSENTLNVSSIKKKNAVNVTVSITDSYQAVATAVAKAVGATDYRFIQLVCNFKKWNDVPFVRSDVHMKYLWLQTTSSIIPLMYRPIPVPIDEFEQLDEVSVISLPHGCMGPKKRKILWGEPDKFVELKFENHADDAPDAGENVLFWGVKYHRVVSELTEVQFKELKAMGNNLNSIFAMQLPQLEVEARALSERTCEAIHFTQEPIVPHGVPFRFALVPKEKFSVTKLRICHILKSQNSRSVEEIKELLHKTKFVIVNLRGVIPGVALRIENEDLILSEKISVGFCLGLIHPACSRQGPQTHKLHID